MTIVISDLGVTRRMEILRGQYNTDALKVRLFQNNLTPDRTKVLADFTEATFDGYAAQTIATWTTSSLSAHIASSAAAALTFTKTAGATGNSIYGYYVTDTAGTVLYWSERDGAAPINMSVTGNQYIVTINDNYQNLAGVA